MRDFPSADFNNSDFAVGLPPVQVYPNTATRLEIPILAFIKRRDPTFFRDRANVDEYCFSNGRSFTADPTTRGAYGEVVGPDDFFETSTPDVGTLGNVFHDTSSSSDGVLDFSDPNQSGLYEVVP
jgi:hypothetical protein